MKKIIFSIIFSLLLASSQVIANETAQYNQDEEFDFDNQTYYVSDEQLEDAKNINKIEDDNTSIWTKIINSSHFSSGTATRTWIPIRKNK